MEWRSNICIQKLSQGLRGAVITSPAQNVGTIPNLNGEFFYKFVIRDPTGYIWCLADSRYVDTAIRDGETYTIWCPKVVNYRGHLILYCGRNSNVFSAPSLIPER